MKKYQTRENIKNADLISAFTRCPFADPVEDCPFTPYYKLHNPAEQIRLMNTLSERELQQLRSHHQSCVALRQARLIVDRGQDHHHRYRPTSECQPGRTGD